MQPVALKRCARVLAGAPLKRHWLHLILKDHQSDLGAESSVRGGSMFHHANKTIKRLLLGFSMVFAMLIVGALIWVRGQRQEADPSFDAKVARPAYVTVHPKALIDEAHNNFHTAGGRYKPFATLLTNDGYQVVPNKEKFRSVALKGYESDYART